MAGVESLGDQPQPQAVQDQEGPEQPGVELEVEGGHAFSEGG